MKQKFIKKTVSVFLSILLILTLTVGISAHEMYYTSSGSPIVLKWNNSTGGKPLLQVNGDGLSGPNGSYGNYNYSTEFNAIWSAWNNCAGLVIVERANINNSTVDFTVPSTSTWLSLVGSEDDIYGVKARTKLKDSAGNFITSKETASNSTKKVVYALIYMNPYIQYAFEFAGLDTLNVRSVMVHEMGHALTLGHSNEGPYASSVDSVMQQGTFTFIYPQSHDISDIRAKYG